MPHVRSFIDEQRLAFRELKLLATRRPHESKPWRDVWIVAIPTMSVFFIALFALDPPLLSLTMAGLIAMMAVLPRLLHRVFARAGWVTSRPPRDIGRSPGG